MINVAPPTYMRPTAGEYLAVGVTLAIGIALLVWVTGRPALPADPQEVVRPMVAMFALTAVVWLLMVIARNGAIFLQVASVKYYRDYHSDAPPEWIERPARTFNNLLQVPTLFYVVSLLMLSLPWADSTQVTLAWMFGGSRLLHAIIYIGFNYVPLRFAMYTIGCITLGVMWIRIVFRG